MRIRSLGAAGAAPPIQEAARILEEALREPKGYIVLAEYVTGALAGCPPDPETLDD